MLVERSNVRQIEGEGLRRWFSDDYFDLVVWYQDEDGGPLAGFQLCYDKARKERALTWRPPGRYQHNGIDDGEGPGAMTKMTPVLVADGVFEHDRIAERFRAHSRSIDPVIAGLVYDKVRGYQGYRTPASRERSTIDGQ